MKPYTYLTGWSKLDKWYYGSQYNKNANPDDLWTTYFTSSKIVKKFRYENGEPDIIQIRKCFLSREKVRHYEARVLRRVKAKHSDKWLNQSDGHFKFHTLNREPWNKGIKGCFSEETIKNMSKSRRGKTYSKESSHKKSVSMKGRPKTIEHKLKIKNSNIGKSRNRKSNNPRSIPIEINNIKYGCIKDAIDAFSGKISEHNLKTIISLVHDHDELEPLSMHYNIRQVGGGRLVKIARAPRSKNIQIE